MRAGPCCKGDLRTLPLCVHTALLFLASNGDLPTSAPWLLWYLTEVFLISLLLLAMRPQLLEVDPSPFPSSASFWDEQVCLPHAVAAVQLALATASHELDGGAPSLHHRISFNFREALLAPQCCFCSYVMSWQQMGCCQHLLCSLLSHVRLCCGSDAVSSWSAPALRSHRCLTGSHLHALAGLCCPSVHPHQGSPGHLLPHPCSGMLLLTGQAHPHPASLSVPVLPLLVLIYCSCDARPLSRREPVCPAQPGDRDRPALFFLSSSYTFEIVIVSFLPVLFGQNTQIL